MKHAPYILWLPAAAVLLLLAGCGGPQSNMPTSNPSSTLATDSAAAKVRVSGAAGAPGEQPSATDTTRPR